MPTGPTDSGPTDSGPTPAADRPRPVALVTGVGRTVGIGAAIATGLARTGWDVAFTFWTPYDRRMPWGEDEGATTRIAADLDRAGAGAVGIEADLSDPDVPARVYDQVEERLGPVTALVMCHCESVDSGLLDTTVDSFDRHFAVNARATWLLVREHGLRFASPAGNGRVVALTSDHTVGNLPYGASKGALDRIVLAASHELAHLGVTANVVNPGPVDTGWMDDDLQAAVVRRTPPGRIGTPQDTAALVTFLCSTEGGWVNGQLLSSNGGFV